MSQNDDTVCDFQETKPRRSKLTLNSRSKPLKIKKERLWDNNNGKFKKYIGDKMLEKNESHSRWEYSGDNIKEERLGISDPCIMNDFKEEKTHEGILEFPVRTLNFGDELKGSMKCSNLLKQERQSSEISNSSLNKECELLSSSIKNPMTLAIGLLQKNIVPELEQSRLKECAELDFEHEEKWLCVLCNSNFPYAEQKVHLSQCLKMFEHKDENKSCVSCPVEKNTKHDFHCEICKTDITFMTPQHRCEHINRCMDSQSKNNIQTAPKEIIAPSNERYVEVSECPVCGRQFTSIDVRLAHIKKCCKKHQMEPQKVIFALQLQEKHALERIALGLPPLQIRPTAVKNNPKPKKRKALLPKSGPESDLQIAMALSLSLKEEEIKKQKMLELILEDSEELMSHGFVNELGGKIVDLQPPNHNHFPGNVRPKAKKKNINRPVPTLLLRTEEERLKLLQDKVSSIIAPLSPKKELEKVYEDESTVLVSEEDMQGRSNNLAEACHLWTMAGSREEKDLYYAPELDEWVIPSAVAAGSKLLSLSQIPGHKINHDLGFEYSALYNPEDKGSILSQSCSGRPPCDVPSTQEMIDVITADDTTTEGRNLEIPYDSMIYPINSQILHEENRNNNDGFFPEEDKACGQGGDKPNPVIDCLQKLVGSSLMSDVDIIVQDRRFIPAHRLLLVMRCPIVTKELQMISEAEKISLDWSSVSYQVAMEFLNFIYTGSCVLDAASKEEILQLFLRYDMADAYDELTKDIENTCNEMSTKHESLFCEDIVEERSFLADPNCVSSCSKTSLSQGGEIRLSGFVGNPNEVKGRSSGPEYQDDNFEARGCNGIGKTDNSTVPSPTVHSPSTCNKLNFSDCRPCSPEEITEINKNLSDFKPPNEAVDSRRKFVFTDFEVSITKEEYCQHLSPGKTNVFKLNPLCNSLTTSENVPSIDSPLKTFSQRRETFSPLPVCTSTDSIKNIDIVTETDGQCENLSPEKYVMCKLNPLVNSPTVSSDNQSPFKATSMRMENGSLSSLHSNVENTEEISCSKKSALGLLFGNGSFTSPLSKSNVYLKNSRESSPELFVCESDMDTSPVCEASRIIHQNRSSLECNTVSSLSPVTNFTSVNSIDISTPNSSFSEKPIDPDEEEVVIIKEIDSFSKSRLELTAKVLSPSPEKKSLPILGNIPYLSKSQGEESNLHFCNLNSPGRKPLTLSPHEPKFAFLGGSENLANTPLSHKSRSLQYRRHKRKLSDKFSSYCELNEFEYSKTTGKSSDINQPSFLSTSNLIAKEVECFNLECDNDDGANLSKRSKIIKEDISPNQNIAHSDSPRMAADKTPRDLPDVWEGFDDAGFNDNFVFCNDEITRLKLSMQDSPLKNVPHRPPTPHRPSTSHHQSVKKSSKQPTHSNDYQPLIGKPLPDLDSTSDDELPSFFGRVHSQLNEQKTCAQKLVEIDDNVLRCSTPDAVLSPKLEKSKSCVYSSSPITPMPNYKTLMTPELKLQLQRFGVRALSRNKAVAVLQHIYDETHPWETGKDGQSNADQGALIPKLPVGKKKTVSKCSQVSKTTAAERKKYSKTKEKVPVIQNSDNISPVKLKHVSDILDDSGDEEMDLSSSQTSSKSDVSDLPEETILESEEDSDMEPIACSQDKNLILSDRILNYISSNKSLYGKILIYEPLNLAELQKELKESGIKTSVPKLMDFLDEQCITFTLPRSEKFQKKQQERNKRFRKRVLSQLSQKIS